MNEELKKFLDKGILPIEGEINTDKLRMVLESLGYLITKGSPDIQVLISSNGGDVDSGLLIYDVIDTYPGKTFGKVFSKARSMGAIILQACTTREATRHSYILIHYVSKRSVTLDVLNNEKKRQEIIQELVKIQEKIYQILERRTKKSREEIVAKCALDEDMTAEQALEFGLISKITESSPKED